MFLKSLKIECDGRVIREINFHIGMNLIVDETSTDLVDLQQSGNNVGKTTVLRLIDFCLGGKSKNIFQDPEFKNHSNEEIKSFLTGENVIITLILKEDLDKVDSREIVIRRNFLSRKHKIIEINGKAVKDTDLDVELKQLCFSLSMDKPTFRQILAKNIRDEAARLENTVKVLGSFGKKEEYEALYLFWLGIDIVGADEKRALLTEKKIEKKLLKRLRRINSESKLQQFLEIICRDIKALEVRRDSFNLNPDYEDDLLKLNEAKSELNRYSSEISRLELRKELIVESQHDLEADKANIDVNQIKRLYSQAKVLVPDLQKSFEQTVDFHNRMIAEKVQYITMELPELERELSRLRTRTQQLLVDESKYADKLLKAGAVEELQKIIGELNKLYEQKGQHAEKMTQLIESTNRLKKIAESLEIIDNGIQVKDPLIQERVAVFNKYFSEISNNLYGERFALIADFTDGYYQLGISSVSGRAGTGKKKGEIAAFDLAYVKFADELGLDCFHFILHDQMEVVHDNQISGLLSEVIGANCQLIVPILRDKLPAVLLKPELEILSLSQHDKLFKI